MRLDGRVLELERRGSVARMGCELCKGVAGEELYRPCQYSVLLLLRLAFKLFGLVFILEGTSTNVVQKTGDVRYREVMVYQVD